MTRDELIEKVANNIAITCGNDYAYECAIDVIDTIFAALKEPTPQMQIVVSKNWGRRTWEEYKEVINASPLNKGE